MNAILKAPPQTLAHSPVARWPVRRAVALLPGSLPMGGVVENTPVHAFATPASTLAFADQPGLTPRRRDIDVGGSLAFVIDDVITPEEADLLVQASEYFGFQDEAPGISTPPGMRMNKSVHWVGETEMLARIEARIGALLPQRIDGAERLNRLSERLNMYRYDANDVFNRHTDGDWPGFGLSSDRRAMITWPGTRSALTMLLYLNGPQDGVQGGNTRLYGRGGAWVDVVPKKGSALFFRHGFGPDSVVHEGSRVTGEVPKYVARINVLYRG